MRNGRKLFLATAFAAFLSVGAFAGLSSTKESKPAEAATTAFTNSAVYLEPNSNWTQTSARFAVYYTYTENGSKEGWLSMTKVADSFYCARLPEKQITLVIFCRMNGGTSDNNWNNKWNQTGDLSPNDFSSSSAVFKVPSGAWDGSDKTNWKANSTYTSKFYDRYVACEDNNWNAKDENYKLAVDMTKGEGRLVKTFDVSGTPASEELKLTNGSWSEGFGCNTVSDGTDSNYVDISAGGTSNIKLLVSGSYEIYWKYYETSKQIWIQIGSDTEANNYASAFLSAITCTDTSVTSSINAWNKVGSETTSMEYKFSQLTSGAKSILVEATGDKDSSDPVKKCIARYDRILSKYGYGTASGQYHDFMGRTPTVIGNGAIVLDSIVGSSGGTLAIVAISSVSLVAIGGYFLFKKKHQ